MQNLQLLGQLRLEFLDEYPISIFYLIFPLYNQFHRPTLNNISVPHQMNNENKKRNRTNLFQKIIQKYPQLHFLALTEVHVHAQRVIFLQEDISKLFTAARKETFQLCLYEHKQIVVVRATRNSLDNYRLSLMSQHLVKLLTTHTQVKKSIHMTRISGSLY